MISTNGGMKILWRHASTVRTGKTVKFFENAKLIKDIIYFCNNLLVFEAYSDKQILQNLARNKSRSNPLKLLNVHCKNSIKLSAKQCFKIF